MTALVLLTGCPTELEPDVGDDGCVVPDSSNLADLVLDQECYTLDGEFEIAGGDLVIEPGTTINFEPGAGVRIGADASLEAVGTEDDPIHLRGKVAEPGSWDGLYFEDSSASANRLEYVTIEHAGGDSWTVRRTDHNTGAVVLRDGAQLAIANSEFRRNSFSAITATQITNNASLSVASTHFQENELPFRIKAFLFENLSEDLTFEDNDRDVVATDAFDTNSIVTEQVWPTLAVPYEVIENITFDEQASVTLSPGTTMYFRSDRGLDIKNGAVFVADGSDGDPIYFGGTDESPGHWRGLHFVSSSTSNLLDNVEVHHGGSNPWTAGRDDSQGNVIVNDSGQVAINNAHIADSSNHGITVRQAGTITGCENITFENNAADDAHYGDSATVCFE